MLVTYATVKVTPVCSALEALEKWEWFYLGSENRGLHSTGAILSFPTFLKLLMNLKLHVLVIITFNVTVLKQNEMLCVFPKPHQHKKTNDTLIIFCIFWKCEKNVRTFNSIAWKKWLPILEPSFYAPSIFFFFFWSFYSFFTFLVSWLASLSLTSSFSWKSCQPFLSETTCWGSWMFLVKCRNASLKEKTYFCACDRGSPSHFE